MQQKVKLPAAKSEASLIEVKLSLVTPANRLLIINLEEESNVFKLKQKKIFLILYIYIYFSFYKF